MSRLVRRRVVDVASALLLLKTNCRRTSAITGYGRAARCRPACVQRPALTQRGTVTDFDRNAEALRVHLYPGRIGLVEVEWIVGGIARSEDSHRFPRGQDATIHVALRVVRRARAEKLIVHFTPIPDWVVIDLDNNLSYDRGADSLIRQAQLDRTIATVELENRPDGRAHLLALHVCRIGGNTQSQESYQAHYDCLITNNRSRRLLFRHDADHIAGKVRVNQSGQLSGC